MSQIKSFTESSVVVLRGQRTGWWVFPAKGPGPGILAKPMSNPHRELSLTDLSPPGAFFLTFWGILGFPGNFQLLLLFLFFSLMVGSSAPPVSLFSI